MVKPVSPTCPSVPWTIIWLIVFWPAAVYQALSAYKYQKALLYKEQQPDPKARTIMAIGGLAAVLLLITSLFILIVVVPMLTGEVALNLPGDLRIYQRAFLPL